jgi:hypothetical protein
MLNVSNTKKPSPPKCSWYWHTAWTKLQKQESEYEINSLRREIDDLHAKLKVRENGINFNDWLRCNLLI